MGEQVRVRRIAHSRRLTRSNDLRAASAMCRPLTLVFIIFPVVRTRADASGARGEGSRTGIDAQRHATRKGGPRATPCSVPRSRPSGRRGHHAHRPGERRDIDEADCRDLTPARTLRQ